MIFEELTETLPDKKWTHESRRILIKDFLTSHIVGTQDILYLKKCWMGYYGKLSEWNDIYLAHQDKYLALQAGVEVQPEPEVKPEPGFHTVETSQDLAKLLIQKIAENQEKDDSFYVTGPGYQGPPPPNSGTVGPMSIKKKNLAVVMQEIHHMLASLHAAGLNEKAIVLLLSDSSGLSKTTIKKVLKAMMNLEKDYGAGENVITHKGKPIHQEPLKPDDPPLMDKGDEYLQNFDSDMDLKLVSEFEKKVAKEALFDVKQKFPMIDGLKGSKDNDALF